MLKPKRIDIKYISIADDVEVDWTEPYIYPDGNGLYFVEIDADAKEQANSHYLILTSSTSSFRASISA